MRNLIVLEILARLRRYARWNGRFRVLSFAGLATCLIVGGFGVWLCISTVSHVSEVARTSISRETVESMKRSVAEYSSVSLEGCWQEAKALFSLQAWMERPLGQNVSGLKTACLPSQDVCNEMTCERRSNLPGAKEGART
jgi:hypothetical protein